MAGGILSVSGGNMIIQQGILGIGGTKQYAPLILADGPVAYWRMGESSGPTLADSSGNGFTATENGASMVYGQPDVMVAPDSDGAVGGNNVQADHWTFGPSATLEPTVGVSVEVWMKTNGNNDAMLNYMSANAGDCSGYKLFYGFGTGKFRFYTGTTVGSNANTAGSGYLETTATYSGSLHVVGTFTAGSRIIYVNGVNVDSDTKGGLIQYITQSGLTPTGLIGNELFNGVTQAATAMKGDYDEMAIYDFVLSPTQVLNHYQAGT